MNIKGKIIITSKSMRSFSFVLLLLWQLLSCMSCHAFQHGATSIVLHKQLISHQFTFSHPVMNHQLSSKRKQSTMTRLHPYPNNNILHSSSCYHVVHYSNLDLFCRPISILKMQDSDSDEINNTNNITNKNGTKSTKLESISSILTTYAPIWTTVAAMIGLKFPTLIGKLLGGVRTVSVSLTLLMTAMGLTVTPTAFKRAMTDSSLVLLLNIICCFGLMPLLAIAVAKVLQCTTSQTIGTILLGCVSGGQASNLFALLAGGDVSLSVVCTLSTTLLGVLATPLLVQQLLGTTVAVNAVAVLKSVATLVLAPLVTGLAWNQAFPNFVDKNIVPFCPALGVGATLLLVAGGAANSAPLLLLHAATQQQQQQQQQHYSSLNAVAASFLLPLVGGLAALLLSTSVKLTEKEKRTLVVEVLSKSPTLAYVLALKHFSVAAAAVPAAAMVSLAAVGAAVASAWVAWDGYQNKI